MDRYVIIKKTIKTKFDEFMDHGRILYFGAPCGFGKSTVAFELLRGKKFELISGLETDGILPEIKLNRDIVVIDDLQEFQEDEDLQKLNEIIRDNPQKKFVLLSRGVAPGVFRAFQYTGDMIVIGVRDFLFDRDDIRQMLFKYNIKLTDSEINEMLKESIGYPLGVAATLQCINHADGQRVYNSDIIKEVYHEVFLYFEAAIYHRFDLPIRRLLLELASFDNFDYELARMVSGDPNTGELLDWIQKNTTMLLYDGIHKFRFWPQFRDFLLWELERKYSSQKKNAVLVRGGMYYELNGDYEKALDCYSRGKDHSKVSEILIRNGERHPGMGHYSEMEKYYRSLPESEILESPSLMQGMSMLCALNTDYENSERWYHELEQFAAKCKKQDAVLRQIKSRIAWLDISLPQRKTDKMIQIIPSVFRLITNREVKLPPFSVTSTLPSIMNGGKDFSPWSKIDDLLYQTMCIPVEAVLGKDGVGLADCAIAESKFEKGEDISGRILLLVSQLGEVQKKGTPDIEFAMVGLLARSQIALGRAEDALRTVQMARERFEENGHTRFFHNIDAVLCRIWLHMDDLERVQVWYREKAPKDPLHLNVLKRYQYLTQAMAELALGMPDAALLTLAPLESYCKDCSRYIDGIHINVLEAIALYRKKDSLWKEKLNSALDAAQEFGFIRTISVYGAAVLSLLEQTEYKNDDEWFARLIKDVRVEASFYPDFLQPHLSMENELTATELQILRLICADKSNAQIGQIMDIKLPTVKTHVSHILTKLDVSRRSEAKTAAKRLWLIPADKN